jgi:hypothetical protein
MRRGKLTSANIFLIVIVAIFTLLSYLADQLVIRNEDKLRGLNIKYNNTKTRLLKYTSITESITLLGVRADFVMTSYLNKRNIWIKSLILLDIDKKNEDLFLGSGKGGITKTRSFKYDFKYNLAKHFVGIFVDKESIRKEFSDIYLWNNELFEEINKKAEKQSNQLFNFDKIFEDNIGDFFFTNKKMYNDLLYTEHDERGKFFDNYSLTNWIDIHTYQILCFKKMVEDIEHLKFFTDYIDKLILDEEKILANTFFVQKKTTLTKNYLILFSILTQILSLVTLLFLFRNLIKKR